MFRKAAIHVASSAPRASLAPIVKGLVQSLRSSVGAKAVMDADGVIQGTIGGGWVEAETQRRVAETIASGRPPGEVISFARQLGLSSLQISDGGATILDPVSGRPVWRSAPLAPEHTRSILARLRHRNLAFIATHPGGIVTDQTEFAGLDLYRISAMDLEEPVADELVSYFSEPYRSNPYVETAKMFLPTSGLWGVNFSPCGVNKGWAAIKLSTILGVESAQMIAVGDSYNDISLFEVCELRIAMGDAPR